MLFGSFLLFARFRFADPFIRYSVRILVASAFTMMFIAHMQWPIWGEALRERVPGL